MIRAISVLLLSLGLILRPPVAHADDLSTRIAAANAYLATRPGTVGYVLRDRSTGAAYRNPDAGALIWTASTIKLAIVVDLLARTYAGQVRLSDQDRQLISAMLHSSDNDAADTLWDRYGGPDHQAFNRNFPRYGMPGVVPQRGFSDTFPYWGFQKASANDLDGLINYTLTRLNPTDTDASNCGGCGNVCPTPANGRALCVTGGLARCVDLLNDASTCGTCERACSEGQACSNGRCVCAPGRTLCGMRCADTESDPGNCGGCGVACPAVVNGRAACRSRACGFACAEGYHACGNTCVADSSPLTCGTLCVPCPAYTNATPTCNGAACGFACIMGYHQCGAACVNNLAVATCGALCTPCPAPTNSTPTCNGTECGFACNTGFHRCGDMCLSNAAPTSCGAPTLLSPQKPDAPPMRTSLSITGLSIRVCVFAGTRPALLWRPRSA